MKKKTISADKFLELQEKLNLGLDILKQKGPVCVIDPITGEKIEVSYESMKDLVELGNKLAKRIQ